MAGSNDHEYTLPADFAKHYLETSPGNRQIERQTTFALTYAAATAQVPGLPTGLSPVFPGADQDFDIRRNPLGFDIHKDPLAFYVPGGSMFVWAHPVTDFHRPGKVRMSSLQIEVGRRSLSGELLQTLADRVLEVSRNAFRLHTDLCAEVHQPELWEGLTGLDPHYVLFLDQRTAWLDADQWGLALAKVCAELVNSLKLWGALKIQALNITRISRSENDVLVHRAPKDAFAGLVGGDGAVRYAYADLDGDGNIWGTESEIKLLREWQEAS